MNSQVYGRKTDLNAREATLLLLVINKRNPLYCHPLRPEELPELVKKLEQMRRDG